MIVKEEVTYFILRNQMFDLVFVKSLNQLGSSNALLEDWNDQLIYSNIQD